MLRRVALKSIMTMSGEQYVTMDSMRRQRKLCVVSWALATGQVSSIWSAFGTRCRKHPLILLANALGATVEYFEESDKATPMWLDDVGCKGNELTLGECAHRKYGNNNCRAREQVGVVCNVEPATPQGGNLRLVGGTGPANGRVEIFHGGRWETICGNKFGEKEAAVACRQLGFSSKGKIQV